MRHFVMAAIVLCVGVAGVSQPAGPLMQCTFDADTDGWSCTKPNEQPAQVRDEQVTREGGGVLEHSYIAQPGDLSALAVSTPRGLPGGKSVRFWLKTTAPALMTSTLVEEDGSRYVAMFTSMPGVWQEMKLSLGEHALTEGSQDENDRLDAWQVQAVMLADVTAFFASAAVAAPFLEIPELGPRKLWLDDFAVFETKVASRGETIEIDGVRAMRLESFETTTLQWQFYAGAGTEVSYDPSRAAHGDRSLVLRYDLPKGMIVAAATRLNGLHLKGTSRIRLSAVAEHRATLLVELRERDGTRYRATLSVPPGDELRALDVAVSDLNIAEGMRDENDRLDMRQVVELTLAEISGLGGEEPTVNALWLDDIVFVK